MCGKFNKNGFTLLELLVVMLIMGAVAALVGPSLFSSRTPRYEREEFVARLDSLVATAVLQAILERTVHSLEFDFKKRTVDIKRAPYPSAPVDDFELVKGLSSAHYSWPEQFEIKQFLVGGSDLMKAFSRNDTGEAWFFVIPDGMAQEVTINFLDTKDTIEGAARKVGLVLNPFTAQFKTYDEFQK
jgi:prepilin-type N-terminal cleavage/methylation domain-containing protein